MIKIGIILFISILSFASNDLSLNTDTDEKLIVKYTLQISSVKTKKLAIATIKDIPEKLKKDVHLYKVGKYVAIRYSSADKAKILKKSLQKFKDIGFKDAYIVKSTKWHMKNSILDRNRTKKKEEVKETKKKEQITEIEHTQAKYARSNMVQKADMAYKSGDESTAMLYYEMLLNSNNATHKIKNNLCYLYGKRGAWFEAKNIIEKERYASMLIYAYAYGSIETNQQNFMINLSQYIMMDKSGKLALLAGYYYEQKEDMLRALSYYKISYNKNPSDVNNIFAYARSLDIKQDFTHALKLYKKVLYKINKNNDYYFMVTKRVSQLQEAKL